MKASRRFVAASAVVPVLLAISGVGNSAHASTVRFEPVAAPQHHVRGDFDGDAKTDLVASAPGGDRVRISYTHAHPGGSRVQWLNLPEAGYTMNGEVVQFGATLAVGDFNGDGYADLAVGAPSWTNPVTVGANREEQGALYLYRGSATGLHYTTKLHGPYDGDDPFNLASILASADINRDGYDDLAVKVDGGDTQQIEILHGSASGLDLAAPQFFNDFGARSFGFGDINRDGFPDLALGDNVDLSNPTDVFRGAVEVFYGSASGLTNAHHQLIRGNSLGVVNGLGSALAVGDLNHDGYADVVVGDASASHYPNHLSPGKIVILYGGKHGISAARHRTLDERRNHLAKRTGTSDLFGNSLSIGRVNRDKYPDILVGAPGARVKAHSGAGAIYVIPGSKSGVRVSQAQRLTQAAAGVPGNPQHNGHFGWSVSLALVNGDRYADAIVGAPGASVGVTAGGFVAVLRGSKTLLTTTHAKSFADSSAGDFLGTVVAG